ncbi:MAG TPA: SMP-30/gluconolactonase/LRE family protein [Acidimicrobiia bacterium]|jgi:sugar lactone lactonase YvrE
MSNAPSKLEARVLLSDLAYVESPRWRDGRLWFAHWGRDEVVAVDLDGTSDVVAPGSPRLGWSIDWLPDGRLLVTGDELRRREPDGTMVRHADLSAITEHGWNEIVVDGRGNIYVNSICFDFLTGGEPKAGIIALVTPDGSVRQVADGLEFPNGMVVTPDNATLIISESFAGRLTAFDIETDGALANRRSWADGIGPDGITLDADGAIWTGSGGKGAVRVARGGEVLETVELDRDPFACMLGGPDGRTLFVLAAEWRGPEHVDEAITDRTGRVLVADAPSPRAGWP